MLTFLELPYPCRAVPPLLQLQARRAHSLVLAFQANDPTKSYIIFAHGVVNL